MQTEQSQRALQQNRRSAEAQAQGERETKSASGMVFDKRVALSQSMAPGPSIVPVPEAIPIPDAADDLVIEILPDQMIDFDECATGVLEIFAVTELKSTRRR